MKRFLIVNVLLGVLAVASLIALFVSAVPLARSSQFPLTHTGEMRERASHGFDFDGCCVNIAVRVGDIVIKVHTSDDCHN